MITVAVIPARAGSKGIPNKNIRLLGGKPLICYAIENAIHLPFLNQIIVSTDSEVVATIAGRYPQVTVRKRPSELARDEVTLDAVIFDAVKDVDCDSVITLQPTSPTLSALTISSAFSFFVQNGFDTVISGYNSPHLSWSLIDGSYSPNYQKRLNRQYLPKYIIESGGFLITRKKFISSDNRIGPKVSVFEIPPNEAIDIDTFEDFRDAEFALKSKIVGFLVNGNLSMGMGHIYRALEIADALHTKPTIFFDSELTEKRLFGETTYPLVGFRGVGNLYSLLAKSGINVFINDTLSTSRDYMIGLRKALGDGARIINFEDEGQGAALADVVVNALLPQKSSSKILSGPSFYFAPKLYSIYPHIHITKVVHTVGISFGGADPSGFTESILRIIHDPSFFTFHFLVILGKAKINSDQIIRNNDLKNVEFFKDVPNMPDLMSRCDVFVTSRGRTCFECAYLGIPTLAMAQNDREKRHSFANPKNGFLYAGEKPNVNLMTKKLKILLMLSKRKRLVMQKKMLKNDLHHGYEKIVRLVEE